MRYRIDSRLVCNILCRIKFKPSPLPLQHVHDIMHSIWRENNITCDVTGVRCKGTYQECIFPHYATAEYSSPYTPCGDKSDQVFRAGLTCWDIALDHVKTYCDTFCTPEQKKLFEQESKKPCSEKCDVPTSWLSNQTDPYILDPHLCQDSCQNSSLHCEACSNEKYRRCHVNNVPVCYHPDLWCDGHPACDNAEDEPITDPTCYQKLLSTGED